jgi:poly(hydroxyalkanoate) granule-associated protein
MAKAENATVMDSAKQLGDDVFAASRNLYLFGLGTAATAEREARGVFERMVARGEDVEKSGKGAEKSLVDKATGSAKELGRFIEDKVQATVTATLARAGVPSRAEIQTLIERVEQLTEKVDALSTQR